MSGTEITTASSALQITSKQQVITKYDQCIGTVKAKEVTILTIIKEYSKELLPTCGFEGDKFDNITHLDNFISEAYKLYRVNHYTKDNCYKKLSDVAQNKLNILKNQYSSCDVQKNEDTQIAFDAINSKYDSLFSQMEVAGDIFALVEAN